MMTQFFYSYNDKMSVVKRTCQDESYESKETVDEPKDDTREDYVSNERLDTLDSYRLLLHTIDQHNLATTSTVSVQPSYDGNWREKSTCS